MAQKYLRELLREDQEPFQLKHYISDRRCQIRRLCPKTDLQVKKRKPISKNPSFPSNLCESSCFFAGHGSPDATNSPLFEFRSPGKSPNRVFLHVPAGTAAILLEAAARVQKQSSKNAKSKVRNRGSGFGLFGSVLKRLTHRNPARKPELVGNLAKVKLRLQKEEQKSSSAPRFSCSSSGNRSRNAVWSERSLDSDSDPSSSCRHESFEELDEFGYGNADAGDFDSRESPFRFVLQTSPSSAGRGTPHFTSPATSPTRHCTEDQYSDETESFEKSQERQKEEDKEQCSPVSVLDPPFEEDRNDDDDREDDLDLDLECSFEVVQRAKRRLLEKLRRFEQLAGLDPAELERRMSDQEEEEENNDDDDNVTLYDSEEDEGELEVLGEQISPDYIMEEETKKSDRCGENETDMERIWKKLSSWGRIRCKAIDEMVELDLRDELGEWRKNQEEIQEAALDIELAIFGFLVEELSQEVVSCP